MFDAPISMCPCTQSHRVSVRVLLDSENTYHTIVLLDCSHFGLEVDSLS